MRALSEGLLKPQQHLDLVRYFTTMVRNNPPKAKRQSTFIEALRARGGIEIDFGHFLSKTMKCPNCGNEWTKIESIHTRFPEKRIIVAFPPKRHSAELKRVANESFTIGKGKIRSNRLPDPVVTPDGIALQAPAGWLPASQ